MKPKKCPICEKDFTPTRNMQKVCGPLCSIEYPNWLAEKKQRQMCKRMKADYKLKDRGDQTEKAQKNFNKYIRLRDYGQPCISCQRMHQGQIHAGHYRSVGACPELRFEELNVHAQCSVCNNHKSGNAIEYRINLVNKIGVDQVEWLEGPHDPLKLTIDEIIEVKKSYARKARELERDLISAGIIYS